MAPIVPNAPPTEIRAGDTVRFTFAHSDFPASAGWVLSYTLNGAGKVAVDATASGDEFSVTVNATASAQLLPGTYTYTLHATLSGARYTVAAGKVAVLPNLAAAVAGSLTDKDELELGYLNAEIAARLQSDHTEYAIDGRSLKREALTELHEMRDILRARIARRRRGGKLGMATVQFTTPGAAQ